MSAVETLPASTSLNTKRIADNTKPLWSDDEDSDNETDKKGVSVNTNTVSERKVSESKEKKESLLGPDFDSKWDHFPTSQEFKSIYGDAIWEQLEGNYNDLAKSLSDITKKPVEPETNKEKETRTTCWDALDTPQESNVISPLGVGRPPSNPGVGRGNGRGRGRGRGSGRGRGGGRPPGSGRKPGQTSSTKISGSIKCHRCEKTFDAIVQARPHLTVHSGIKPYKCSQCDYRSYSKHNVTNVHWTNKHGRKGTNDDVVADEKEKEDMKEYVRVETEKMLEVYQNVEQTFTSPKKPDKSGEVDTNNNDTKPKTDESDNGSKETTTTKETSSKGGNTQDEDDMDISEDLLDSLCAESNVDSSEKKDANDKDKTE